jgi:hypothetical protein
MTTNTEPEDSDAARKSEKSRTDRRRAIAEAAGALHYILIGAIILFVGFGLVVVFTMACCSR